MTRPARLRYVTVVATVALPDGQTVEDLEDAVTAALDRRGAELIGCNWSPDQDTVADGIGCDYDEVGILDLNPGRTY